ncbi:MAG: gamma carbonic anhydrase family protein [Bacillota bacterium]|nr:gamma carbonic anhydrase family protein [Bacillota bacterium]
MKIYVAKDADVLGNVMLSEDVNIWFHSTLRADSDIISIGKGSNIQDNCVLHVDPGHPVIIKDYVTVGHGAILHGCTVEENTVIGMGAIVLNGAHIGKNCIIGAGTLISQNKEIPDNSIVIGNPGKILRPLNAEEIQSNHQNALLYIEEAKAQLEEKVL